MLEEALNAGAAWTKARNTTAGSFATAAWTTQAVTMRQSSLKGKGHSARLVLLDELAEV
ncbi:MAG: hypothetical protein GDA52_08135 [Rhodobacteraceae bacterium]|nr:hypothetical protein [Paracoccaceae bacterium]